MKTQVCFYLKIENVMKGWNFSGDAHVLGCGFCRELQNQAYRERKEAEERDAHFGPNPPMNSLCGATVRVQRVGGGVRWACPKCDIKEIAGLPNILWTNSTPPRDRLCQKPKVLRMQT